MRIATGRPQGRGSVGLDLAVLACVQAVKAVERRHRPAEPDRSEPSPAATRSPARHRVTTWVLVGAACGLFAAAGAVTAATWPTAVSRGVVPRPALPVAFSPGPAAAVPTASPPPMPVSVSVPAVKPVAVPHWRGPLVSGPIRPLRIVIPAAGVDAPVVAEAVSRTGSLGVPDDPAVLGWWGAGPLPGAARGTAVIDGHVDSEGYGLGALVRLGDVVPGQQLAVTGMAGSEVFIVDAVRQLSKGSLASAGVFDQALGGRLVIVTCGGPFDPATHTYRDNIVVYATPATR